VSLYLVDGTFELFRCFHGAPRHRIGGQEVGAVRGLLWTLVSLLRTPDLTHVALAFDRMPRPRPGDAGADALIRGQASLAADVVRALGIVFWPAVRWQADDLLATGAARYAAEVDRLVLCSTDKDLSQCVRGQRVVLLDRIRKRETDEDGVRERFGVAPAQMPDWFALVGDPSDGLAGLPGWGPKAAGAVLTAHGRVEDIPLDPARWGVTLRGAERLAAVLAERRDEAILYRDLSILRTDLPLPQTLADLSWRGAHASLRALARDLEVEDALDAVPRWA
jgi:5'-3' exonuclease